MTRRTYQQVQAWHAAAVALLAEVGVEVKPWSPPTDADVIVRPYTTHEIKVGRGVISIFLTGSVSIGGPAADADYLCEPLERHGLLNGWHPGSRGSGVVWVPQPAKVEKALAIAACTAEVDLRQGRVTFKGLRPDTGGDVVVRLRDWRDELAASGKPHEVGPWIARELERRFPEILTTDPRSGRVKP